MDRWPPYGGGREGRFDCIYIYIYIYICFLQDKLYVIYRINNTYVHIHINTHIHILAKASKMPAMGGGRHLPAPPLSNVL